MLYAFFFRDGEYQSKHRLIDSPLFNTKRPSIEGVLSFANRFGREDGFIKVKNAIMLTF